MSEVSGDVVPHNSGSEMRCLQDHVCLQGLGEDADFTGDSTASSADTERVRQKFRHLAKTSLYFLAKAILGFSDMTKEAHLDYCLFLQDLSNRKILDLMPRGVFKTSIGSIAFAIWYLLNFPHHTILLINQIQSNAERILQDIEAHLDGSNPLMNWLFPEFIKPYRTWKPWSNDKMTLPPSSYEGVGHKFSVGTPSVQAIGVGMRVESMHFHVIINDDLIGQKAQASDAIMTEAIEFHDYSTSLFVKQFKGIERMHGTRWSLNDLYAVTMQDPTYKVFLKSAIDPETGKSNFPQLLPLEYLRELREKNYAHFMSQYMNDPENPDLLDFRAGWLKLYNLVLDTQNGEPYCELEGEKYYVKDMNVGLFVDPAGSGDIEDNFAKQIKRGRAKKANNAVGIWGLHGSGKYFLLELWTGRGRGINPEEQVAIKMFEMAHRWRGYVSRGYVESYGAQRALITVFNMVCRKNEFHLTMEETPRGVQKAKKVRIRTALSYPASNGQLCIRHHHDQFIYEFSKFPQSDVLDTLDMTYWAIYHLKKPQDNLESHKSRLGNMRRLNRRIRSISKVTGY